MYDCRSKQGGNDLCAAVAECDTQCRNSLQLNSLTIRESSANENAINIWLSAPPTSTMKVQMRTVCPIVNSVLRIDFDITSWYFPAKASTVMLRVGNGSGKLNESVSLLRLVSSEYSVEYVTSTVMTVLALNQEPSVPTLSSAYFSNGSSIILEFSTAIDRGGFEATTFMSQKLLRF